MQESEGQGLGPKLPVGEWLGGGGEAKSGLTAFVNEDMKGCFSP